MAIRNEFDVKVLPDGKIEVTSPGSFSGAIHEDADKFLEMIQELAGGATIKKKLQQTLGNAQQEHTHKHQHRH
jgi:hypothetical protein